MTEFPSFPEKNRAWSKQTQGELDGTVQNILGERGKGAWSNSVGAAGGNYSLNGWGEAISLGRERGSHPCVGKRGRWVPKKGRQVRRHR